MESQKSFRIGRDGKYRYLPTTGLIDESGVQRKLTAAAELLLHTFLERPGKPIERSDLLKLVWGENGVNVADNSLSDLISKLRTALGDDAKNPTYIRTIPGRGYRFIAPVMEIQLTELEPSLRDIAQANETQPEESIPPAPGRGSVPIAGTSFRSVGSDSWVGRHWGYALAICALYALHQFLAEAAEAAFVFENPATFIMRFAPLNAICVFAAAIGALYLDAALTARGKRSGLGFDILMFIGGLAVVLVIAWQVFPENPPSTVSRLGWPARAGFFKSAIIYPLLLAIPFIVLPFHTIAAFEAELQAGHREQVSDVLFRVATAIPPRGALFLRPVVYALVLAGIACFGVPMTLHLLDSVRSGSQSSLFAELALFRFVSWYGVALSGLAWYAGTLDNLKREASLAG
jgi:DNA-binding winged helix-turn-helix (wHTH) protein